MFYQILFFMFFCGTCGQFEEFMPMEEYKDPIFYKRHAGDEISVGNDSPGHPGLLHMDRRGSADL